MKLTVENATMYNIFEQRLHAQRDTILALLAGHPIADCLICGKSLAFKDKVWKEGEEEPNHHE